MSVQCVVRSEGCCDVRSGVRGVVGGGGDVWSEGVVWTEGVCVE